MFLKSLVYPVYFLWLFLSACLLFSCGHNRLEVNVSSVQMEAVKIPRFDRDFFALNATNISQALPALQKKYPGFAEPYLINILRCGGMKDNACIPEIIRFVSDKDMRETYQECQKVFPVMNPMEDKLRNVFLHYKYYYPQAKIPNVIAIMSGFYCWIGYYSDTALSISLEMYLGNKNRLYDMLPFPNYKRVNMRKEYIVSDFVHAWMLKLFPNSNKSGTLLNEMIYQGKLLYLADALMPEETDTLKIGFTKNQLDWCVKNENNVWGYFIKNKFLYSNDITVVTKFTGEAPFTTGFVKESPGRTGVWIGWRIVRKYMDNNPKVTLDQLMQENDPQKILSQSRYKP
jgi:gliding motility-associated lipoprotein GldB